MSESQEGQGRPSWWERWENWASGRPRVQESHNKYSPIQERDRSGVVEEESIPGTQKCGTTGHKMVVPPVPGRISKIAVYAIFERVVRASDRRP